MNTLTSTHGTPSKSFGTGSQKSDGIGWISQSTYQDLPARFQALARKLASMGEIVIERADE